MSQMSKLPYASLVVSIIAIAITSGGTPNLSAWPYTQDNVNEYPMPMTEGDTVPFYAVCLFGVLLWIVFGLVEIFACNRDLSLKQRLRFAILIGMTMLEIFFVTATLTTMCKYFVAEPRPDFKTRCLGSPGAVPTYDANGNVICTGSTSVIHEGRNAFPSGHASTALCFGVFGTCYLMWLIYLRKIHLPWRTDVGCMTVFWYQVSHALFCACLFPLFVALAIACTRVKDHLHSPADITAGALLGTMISVVYFYVRIVFEAPELDCLDTMTCDCGQLYKRIPSSSLSSSTLPPLSPTSPNCPSGQLTHSHNGHMQNTHFSPENKHVQSKDFSTVECL
jgi:membrane-associated phospholipid phosphatase